MKASPLSQGRLVSFRLAWDLDCRGPMVVMARRGWGLDSHGWPRVGSNHSGLLWVDVEVSFCCDFFFFLFLLVVVVVWVVRFWWVVGSVVPVGL